MTEFVYITGINGVGKTSLAERAAKLGGWQYVSASGLLRHAYSKANSSELEKCSQKDLDASFTAAFLGILANSDKKVLLDTHAVVFLDDGTEIPDDLTNLFPFALGIIHINATPSTILDRCRNDNGDGKKIRNQVCIDVIKHRSEVSLQHANRMSQAGGFSCIEFQNDVNGLDERAYSLMVVIQNLKRL